MERNRAAFVNNLASGSRGQKFLIAVLAFILLEVWVYTAAGASPGGPATLEWEAPVSLLAFVYACYQGARLLLLTPRYRALLAFMTLIGVTLLVATVVPVRRVEQGAYSVTVHKGARILELFRGTESLEKYQIGLGGSPVGDKLAEGDLKTPEGDFYVTDRAPSQFHKWLGLSYPDSRRAWQGRLNGKITWLELWYLRVLDLNEMIPYSHTALGGDVGIHGGGSQRDWTLGCIAMDNDDLDKLYEVVTPGTRVRVLP